MWANPKETADCFIFTKEIIVQNFMICEVICAVQNLLSNLQKSKLFNRVTCYPDEY